MLSMVLLLRSKNRISGQNARDFFVCFFFGWVFFLDSALSVSLLKWDTGRGLYFLTGTLVQSTVLAEM